MRMFEITYRCRERDEGGLLVEGENCCRLRVEKVRTEHLPDGSCWVRPAKVDWVEDAIAGVERLQGREYLRGSICDIRLAEKED